jgi:hypothetical protein
MTFWTSTDGGCLNCCLASLVDVHPVDVPHEDDDWLDLHKMNRWLVAEHGRRLEEVWWPPATPWGHAVPAGEWIALIDRGPRRSHAVLARGTTRIHDPGLGDGRHTFLSPQALAHAYDQRAPLGYKLTAV